MASESDFEAALPLGTGLSGLDSILGGNGIEILPSVVSASRAMHAGKAAVDGHGFPSLAITGWPGTGKTTIGLILACAALQRDRSAIIITTEEDPASVIYKIQKLTSWPAHVRAYEDNNPKKKLRAESLKGRQLLISYYPPLVGHSWSGMDEAGSIEGIFKHLDNRVKALNAASKPCEVIVIDGLWSADLMHPSPHNVNGNLVDGFEIRNFFKSICELGSDHRALLVMVLEKFANDDWREFVADIVLQLGWFDAPDDMLHQRYIQAVKSRYQRCLEGRHLLKISQRLIAGADRSREALQEVEVIVRTAEILAAARAQPAEVPHTDPVKFSCDDVVNRFLDRQEGHIAQGTSTLLYGEDATHKNILAVRFLQEAVRTGESGLFIACGTRPAVADDVIARYYLRSQRTDEIQELRRFTSVLEGPLAFESVAEFLTRIDRLLARRTQPHRQVTRVVLDDLSALQNRQAYTTALKDLLTSRGISSLFVHTLDKGTEDTQRELYDNVIKSQHLLLPDGGSTVIGYRVLKYKGASTTTYHSWQLAFDEESGALTIADSLRYYRERPDGTLQYTPWHLHLYVPFSDKREYWPQQIAGLFSTLYTGKDKPNYSFFGRIGAEAVLENILNLPPDYHLEATQIVDLDEYWVAPLANSGRLYRLDDIFNANELAELENRFPIDVWMHGTQKFAEPDRVRTSKMGEVEASPRSAFAVPHHLDFGIYTVREDLLKLAEIKLDDPRLGVYFSWQEMQNIGQQVLAACKKDGRWSTLPQLFDPCSNRNDESFLCFVLEVLWRFITNPKGEQDWTDFDCQIARDATEKIIEHLQQLGAFPVPASPLLPGDIPADQQDRFNVEPALFQRHWFVSYWWTMRFNPDLRGKLRILPYPELQVGNAKHKASPIRGDWFLGVIRGSPNRERAKSVLRMMTSEAANWVLFANEIGLPAYKDLLQAEVTPATQQNTFLDLYQQAVSRTAIPAYYKLRTFLISRLRSIFSHPSGSGKERIKQAFLEIQNRIRTEKA